MTDITIDRWNWTINDAAEDPVTGGVNLTNEAIARGARVAEWYSNRIDAALDEMQVETAEMERLNTVQGWTAQEWVDPAIGVEREDLLMDLLEQIISTEGGTWTDFGGYLKPFTYADGSGQTVVRDEPFWSYMISDEPYIPGYRPPSVESSGVVRYATSGASNVPAPVDVYYPNPWPDQTAFRVIPQTAYFAPESSLVVDRLKTFAFDRAQQLAKTTEAKQAYLQDQMSQLDIFLSFTGNLLERQEHDMQSIADNIR